MAARKPKPKPKNREFKDPDQLAKEAAIADRLYRTVDIFRGLTGQPITLTDSPRSEVGGCRIALPFADPQAYETLEHELAHIVFRSNGPRLRAVAKELARASGFENDVFLLANVLDDHRVDSLWATVYPGSGSEIRSQNIANVSAREKFYVFDFVLRRSLGLVAEDSFTAKYRDVVKLIDTALRTVHLRGPIATEVAIRYLWSDESFRKHLGYGQGPLEGEASPDINSIPGVDGDPASAFVMIPGGLGNGPEIEKLLVESEAAMALQLARLTNPATSDEPVDRVGRGARVVWEKQAATPRPLSPNEALRARRIADLANRIKGRRATELDTTGSMLDIPACIETLVGHQTTDVFRRPAASRGLNCLILVDGSASMVKTWRRAESACRILQSGLASSLLNLTVWGYCSPERGTVLLQDIGPLGEFPPADPKAETPTHLAIREAVRKLCLSSDRRHLVVVTDGEPCYSDEGGSYTTFRLKRDVRREVQALLARGIGLTVLVVPDPDFRLMGDEDLTQQFGNNWTRLAPDRVGEQLVDFVSHLTLQRGLVV